jgi:hypothetical protein
LVFSENGEIRPKTPRNAGIPPRNAEKRLARCELGTAVSDAARIAVLGALEGA